MKRLGRAIEVLAWGDQPRSFAGLPGSCEFIGVSVPKQYLLIAAIAAIIAERIVGAGPYGLIGTILLGVVGIFVMVNLLHFVIPGDPVVGGVPILTAILGAIIVDAIYLAVMRGPRRRL